MKRPGSDPPGVLLSEPVTPLSDAHFAGGSLDPEERLRLLAEWINSGKHVPPSMITNTKRDELLAAGLVTRERLRQLQIY